VKKVPKRIIEMTRCRAPPWRKAVAVEAEEERGFAMRILLHSPKDIAAGALAVAAVGAISPTLVPPGRPSSVADVRLGGTLPAPAPAVASPLPRPRPSNSPFAREPSLFEPKAVEIRSANQNQRYQGRRCHDQPGRQVDSTAPAAASSGGQSGGQANSVALAAPSNVIRPPASIRLLAVGQARAAWRRCRRALTEYGYGQLKPTGAVGADTPGPRFEIRARPQAPVTDKCPIRLVRELTA